MFLVSNSFTFASLLCIIVCSPPSFIDRHGGTRRIAYRTAFLKSTVLLCTFTKLLRYRYRTAVYGTQAPLLLVRVLVRVRDCTVLYCTRTVLYFIQYSPCSYEYRYSFFSTFLLSQTL